MGDRAPGAIGSPAGRPLARSRRVGGLELSAAGDAEGEYFLDPAASAASLFLGCQRGLVEFGLRLPGVALDRYGLRGKLFSGYGIPARLLFRGDGLF